MRRGIVQPKNNGLAGSLALSPSHAPCHFADSQMMRGPVHQPARYSSTGSDAMALYNQRIMGWLVRLPSNGTSVRWHASATSRTTPLALHAYIRIKRIVCAGMYHSAEVVDELEQKHSIAKNRHPTHGAAECHCDECHFIANRAL